MAAVFAVICATGCDDPDAPESSEESTKSKVRSLRKRAERTSERTSDAIRTHDPDTGLDLPARANPDDDSPSD